MTTDNTTNQEPKADDDPHRWEVEPHPYSRDFDYFVTDSDFAARDAILYAAEMHLWDDNEGEERTLRVRMNKDIPAIDTRSRATVAAPKVTNAFDDDVCMFCGGRTEHKPDCSHGRPSPVAPSPIHAENCDVPGCVVCATVGPPAASTPSVRAAAEAAATEICDYCGIDSNDSERVAEIILKHCSPVTVDEGDED